MSKKNNSISLVKDIVNSLEEDSIKENTQQFNNFPNKLDDYVIDSQVEEEYLEE